MIHTLINQYIDKLKLENISFFLFKNCKIKLDCSNLNISILDTYYL